MDWRGATTSLLAFGIACGPGTSAPTSGETGQHGTGEASESDASGGEEDGGEGEAGDTGPDMGVGMECTMGIRLDQCCNSPIATTRDELTADECLVEYPIADGSVSPETIEACRALAPEECAILDCEPVGPASEVVTFDTAGECVFVCPAGESTGYAAPGCGAPGPVLICAPPPPPCANDYCTCDGVTITGCGLLGEPWASEGPCAP